MIGQGQNGARYLKKGARLLCSRPQVKYGFIARHRCVWPIRTICRVSAAEVRESKKRIRELERILRLHLLAYVSYPFLREPPCE